jgi:glucose/arabinose dehydrogenase
VSAASRLLRCYACCAVFTVGGCGDMARLPEHADTGPAPTLAEPNPTKLIPTVKIAPAIGWPHGLTPIAAPGLAVNAYATGFDHPRWIYVLPNGDVLVAETNRPPKKPNGLRAWVMSKVQKQAGAATVSADRITLLRDADGDGVAEIKTTFCRT